MQCQETKTLQHSGPADPTETQQRVQVAAQIFGEYGNDIREIIRFNVRDESLAEDIYQDLFLSLVNAKLPPKIRNMRRFLYRAITNDVISMARRSRRRHTLMKFYAQDFRGVELDADSPSERMIQNECQAQVFSRLERHLSPSEYKAILWRFQRGGGQ